MRLSFFVPWITTGRGGTEHVGAVMANTMAARGHTVTVHSFDDDEQAQARWPLDRRVRLRLHPTVLDVAAETQLLMELAAERPDLIVGLHMNRTMFHYVWAGQKLGVPVLLSEHADPRLPRKVGSFTAAERLVAFAGAAGMHLLLPAYRDELPPALRGKALVLPNAAPPAPEPADPGAEPGLVLCVARLVENKNVGALLRAFAAAPAPEGWRLRLVGYGPQQPALEAEAAALGLRERVEIVHETREVYRHYRAAQVFCLPSLSEAFGLTVIEAMAHGLPVVGLRANRGVSAIVAHAGNGLLAANDGPDLAACLARLMGDAALRRAMGAESLRLFAAHYSAESYGDALEDMLTRAARMPVPRPDEIGGRLGEALAARLALGPQAAFEERMEHL